MTPSKKRTITERMAGAAASVILAGKEYQVSPLGFGAACLWMESALALESELRAALGDGAIDQETKNITPYGVKRLLPVFPRMAELVYSYMGLTAEERDGIDAGLGLDFERSVMEMTAAYFEIQALANPSRAAQMKTATAAMRAPMTMSGRKSR